MSDDGKIEDLKNFISAISKEIKNLNALVLSMKTDHNKLNEIMNLVHNLNNDRLMQNKTVFEVICPDLIRRICSLEEYVDEKKREERSKELDRKLKKRKVK